MKTVITSCDKCGTQDGVLDRVVVANHFDVCDPCTVKGLVAFGMTKADAELYVKEYDPTVKRRAPRVKEAVDAAQPVA